MKPICRVHVASAWAADFRRETLQGWEKKTRSRRTASNQYHEIKQPVLSPLVEARGPISTTGRFEEETRRTIGEIRRERASEGEKTH